MFFEKLIFYFSKKAKLVTFCHHLGKARVKGLPTLRLEAKGLKAWAFRRSVFRAPAMRRGNYLGIEAWILKIRALLNPRLEAQCG